VIGQQVVFETGIGHQFVQQLGDFFILNIDIHFPDIGDLAFAIDEVIYALFLDAGYYLLEIGLLKVKGDLCLRKDIRAHMQVKK
jgi:hypothetical protein